MRQAAATCDFASIADPLDEALRTRFICLVNNEAVLKALFKMKVDELDFTIAIQVAIQTEDAAKVAKEKVYGPKSVPALAIAQKPSRQQPVLQRPTKKEVSVRQQRCYRCGNLGHIATSCKFNDAKWQVQFLQINRTLGGCVSKESAFESSRRRMDRCPGNDQSNAVSQLWGPKASSAYPHQRESAYPGTVHCCQWKFHFYSRLDRVGQALTSTGSVASPFGK